MYETHDVVSPLNLIKIVRGTQEGAYGDTARVKSNFLKYFGGLNVYYFIFWLKSVI